MAFNEHDMYENVRKNLRREYPASEDWVIYRKDRWDGYEPDFVVERACCGRIERVIVEVKAECMARRSHVDQLNRYARNLAGGNAVIVKKILVYPAGVRNTDIIPDDIEVRRLKNFKCEWNR